MPPASPVETGPLQRASAATDAALRNQLGGAGMDRRARAVRALRSELTAAMGEGERLRFELDGVEMEFLLDVRKEASAEADWHLGRGR